MKTFKAVAVFACSFLVLLFTLITKVENTEIVLYKKTVKILMQEADVTSEQELKDSYPTLHEIQSNMNQIEHLNQMVLDKIKSPAPIVTEEESLQLEKHRQRISQLQKEVRTNLSQLLNESIENQP